MNTIKTNNMIKSPLKNTMKSISQKRTIYVVITLIWVGIIFSFSLQPADTSSQLSGGILHWLLEKILPWVAGGIEKLPEETVEVLHFLVRKAGHFTEYMILGILSMLTLSQWGNKHRKIAGLLFCVIVASTDETIQLFVEGRSGQFSDVVLDSVGAMTGMLLFMIKEKIKNGHSRNSLL